MYENYAVANKIELGKVYLWYGLEQPYRAEEFNKFSIIFSPIKRPAVNLVKSESELEAMLYQQKVLVKEFDKG